MDDFEFNDGVLFCEDTNLQSLSEEYGTPVYVYSRRTFRRHLTTLRESFSGLTPKIRYSVKSCGNIHLLKEVASLKVGADVVSGGELYRALLAGIPAERIVFAGVAKSLHEMKYAIEVGVGCINVESEAELDLLSSTARDLEQTVKVAIRVNPDVKGAGTPEQTTTGIRGGKFGIDFERVPDLFDRSKSLQSVELCGIHVHLGSPLYSPEPYVVALERLIKLIDSLQRNGHRIMTLNVGGGFAAQYETNQGPLWSDYAAAIAPVVESFLGEGGRLVLEPGRSISANSGVLLCGVRFLKEAGDRQVAFVDAGMNSFMRPALYDAFHFIWPVCPSNGAVPSRRAEQLKMEDLHSFDIAGPVCESTDYLARNRRMPMLAAGDLICVFGAGAYGMVMASQYNAMPRPPEVLVDREKVRLIRRRETFADLVEAEL